MIPEGHKKDIINDGIRFMKSITSAYGAEKGMELWEQITLVLGKEVKGAIFFAMMAGHVGNVIRFKGVRLGAQTMKINSIKTIRDYSALGLGLKEAKDFIEDVCDRGLVKELVIREDANVAEVVRELTDSGFVVE